MPDMGLAEQFKAEILNVEQCGNDYDHLVMLDMWVERLIRIVTKTRTGDPA